jgi:hypothetical protein
MFCFVCSDTAAAVLNEVHLLMSFSHPNIVRAYHAITFTRAAVHSSGGNDKQPASTAFNKMQVQPTPSVQQQQPTASYAYSATPARQQQAPFNGTTPTSPASLWGPGHSTASNALLLHVKQQTSADHGGTLPQPASDPTPSGCHLSIGERAQQACSAASSPQSSREQLQVLEKLLQQQLQQQQIYQEHPLPDELLLPGAHSSSGGSGGARTATGLSQMSGGTGVLLLRSNSRLLDTAQYAAERDMYVQESPGAWLPGDPQQWSPVGTGFSQRGATLDLHVQRYKTWLLQARGGMERAVVCLVACGEQSVLQAPR